MTRGQKDRVARHVDIVRTSSPSTIQSNLLPVHISEDLASSLHLLQFCTPPTQRNISSGCRVSEWTQTNRCLRRVIDSLVILLRKPEAFLAVRDASEGLR